MTSVQKRREPPSDPGRERTAAPSEHWDTVYGRQTPTAVSWYEPRPSTLDLVEEAAPSKDAWILDVGGGSSLLADRLLERGYTRVAVADVSQRALDVSRSRLGARSDAVRWLREDARRLRLDFQVDVWHDRAVFHFLTTEADRALYVDALLAALRPGGHVVMAAFAPDGPPRCSGLDVVRYDAPSLASVLGPRLTLVRSRPHTHRTPDEREQRFTHAVFRLPDEATPSGEVGPDGR